MLNIKRKTVTEWLKDEGIVIIQCDVKDFDKDKVVDEYEFWITIGYHCTVMRFKRDGKSIMDIASRKLREYIALATEEEKRQILPKLKYIPIAALKTE